MTNYHRAITPEGETIVVPAPVEEHRYMWVDPDPLDLCPAMYDDTRLVELGDLVIRGGDEFRVAALRPATERYLQGQVRAERGFWYSVSSAVLLKRKGE